MVATRTRHPKAASQPAVPTGAKKRPVANGGSAGGKKRKTVALKNGTKTKPAKSTQSKAAKKPKKALADEQYDVEEVRGIMIKGSVTSYFIKWSGYAENQNSWEPSNNVSCEALVKKFLEKSLSEVKGDASEDDEETA